MNEELRCECGKQVSLRPSEAGGRVTCACGRTYTAIGDRIGKVRIVDVLGRGGMGVVYRAKHVDLDRVVALKMLSPALASDEEYVKRFYREARAAARISDPNVVQVHEVGQESGTHYLVMEYVDGRPLSDLLSGRRPLPLRRALDLMEQLLSALRVVHEAGLLHRDIKPANVLLDAKGRVKLTDFGLARPTQGDEVVTLTGMVVGTPQYMSPEQARGGPLDARSDLYSLGVVFFEMLTGRPPFLAETPVKLMLLHASQDAAPRADTVIPSVPASLARLVARMLLKDPEKRAPSAAGLLQELREMRPTLDLPPETEPVAAVEPPPAASRRPWLRPALIAAIGLVALVAILVATWRRGAATGARRETDHASFDADFAAGRDRLREGRRADASGIYAGIDARSSDPATRARARALRAMTEEWVSANGRADEGAFVEAELRATVLAQEAEKLADGEDRVVWRSIVAPLVTKLAGSSKLQEAYEVVTGNWPKKDGEFPPPLITRYLTAFAEKPEHPITARFQDWLKPKLEALCDWISRRIDEKNGSITLTIHQIRQTFPLEPWLTKVSELEERAKKAFEPANTNTKAEKPLYSVPLDFIPSDFILTRDGAFVVALHRSKGVAVVFSVRDRAILKEIAVGYEPTALAEVGDLVYVCGRKGSEIQVIDAAKWERAESIALPSAGPRTIAVAAAVHRVFVATGEHLIEIDPARREVIRKIRHGGGSSRIDVVPTGERLFRGSEIWSTKGEFELEARLSSGVGVPDGQGQHLLSGTGVFDHFGNPRALWTDGGAAVASHPSLPRAYLYKWNRITPVDLYRLRAEEDIHLGESLYHPGTEFQGCAKISSDARTILVGPIQHPSSERDPSKSWELKAFALPEPKASGYFAFTSPPPRDAWLGFPMRHEVRISEPFSKTAKVTLELAPEGMTLDPSTREIRWMPDRAGAVEIQLRAVDSGLDIRQTIQLDVRYRCVLDGNVTITGDGRYLLAERPAGRFYDLVEQRTGAVDPGESARSFTYSGGRFYWLSPRDGAVCSCAPDGTDLQRHRLPGFGLLSIQPKGNTGAMLAIAQDRNEQWQLVTVGDPKPSTLLSPREPGAISISPDGKTIFAPREGGGLGLFRLDGETYRDVSVTGLANHPVRFSSDGGYILHGSGLYELDGLRLIQRIWGSTANFDPSGPYLALQERGSVEVFKLGTLESVGRIEILPLGWRGNEPSISGAMPISSRKIVILFTSSGAAIVPFKF